MNIIKTENNIRNTLSSKDYIELYIQKLQDRLKKIDSETLNEKPSITKFEEILSDEKKLINCMIKKDNQKNKKNFLNFINYI